MRKKLRDAQGFTLVEALCAVMMLMLLCLMMHTGIQLAVQNYHEVTARSETQQLLSSLTDALSDKLRYAVVTQDGAGGYTYSIGEIKTDGSGRAVVSKDGADKKLLPDGAYGEGGRYQVETLTVSPAVSGSVATFTVTLKVREASGTISAQTPEGGLVVRCLNPVKTE